MADKDKLEPMQNTLTRKMSSQIPYLGGKPSPRIGMSGKRMAPTTLVNKAALGTVPNEPSLPVKSVAPIKGMPQSKTPLGGK